MNDFEKLMKWMLAVCLAALLGMVLAQPAFAAGKAKPHATDAGTPTPGPVQVVEISVTEKGFEPDNVKVKKDVPVEMRVTRKTEETCATTLVMPDYGIKQKLPLNESVSVKFTPTKAGSLHYGCGMGMMIHAVVVVE